MDEAFLQSLAAQPNDNVGRLVYADWLQEHDDPRAEFLRLEVWLATNDVPASERGAMVTRLAELSHIAEPGWLCAVNRTPFVSCRLYPRGQQSARNISRPGAKVELANYSTRLMTIVFDADLMQYLRATITDPIGRVWEGSYARIFESERARRGQLQLSLGERYSAHVPLFGIIPKSERMLGRYTIEAAYNYDEVLSQAEPITFELTEEDRNWWKLNPNG
jgi:uncharacterized protein (TIGR02996 family)